MVFSKVASTSAICSFKGSSNIFHSATFILSASAWSFSPFAIKPPISLEAAFTFACVSSKAACNCFLSSSSAITSYTKSTLAKCLTANFCFAKSRFWRKKFTCNMFSNFGKDNQTNLPSLYIPYLCSIN